MSDENLPATTDRPGTLADMMLALARDPSFDSIKFTTLGDFQLKIEDRREQRELADAIQAIQSEIPPVHKNGKIPRGGKDGKPVVNVPFATYEDIMAVLQPYLNAHKIAITFSSDFVNLKVLVTATARKGNATVSSSVPMPIDDGGGRTSAQSHGSSLSYGRRNALEALFNIVRVGADDDGSKSDHKLMTQEQVAELAEEMKTYGISEQTILNVYFGDEYRTLEEVPQYGYRALKQGIDMKKRRRQAP